MQTEKCQDGHHVFVPDTECINLHHFSKLPSGTKSLWSNPAPVSFFLIIERRQFQTRPPRLFSSAEVRVSLHRVHHLCTPWLPYRS